jgi:O-methyltransferase involved in polyketide biosynthesis
MLTFQRVSNHGCVFAADLRASEGMDRSLFLKEDPLELTTASPPSSNSRNANIVPNLTDVSETLLWALHNRASEARRSDGVIIDPEALRIHDCIDYDFGRHFGDPVGSLAVRAAAIDRVLREWLEYHPGGTVVSLGEGLETQCHRVDNGRMRWLSVDLPEAIRLRHRLIEPTERFRQIAVSALDSSWMDAVDPSSGLFVVAQGLLMYLDPEEVHRLFSDIANRFPGSGMAFDVVPRWFSRLTLLGLQQTLHYRLPKMPWGINRDEIEPTLRRWSPGVGEVKFLSYRMPRGLPLVVAELMDRLPIVRHELPSLVHVTMGSSAPGEDFNCLRGSHKTPTESRKQHMQITKPEPGSPETLTGMLEEASRTVSRTNELANASGQIVARRMVLGVAAAMNPLKADHVEFARMVPEKVEAFSAATAILFEHAGKASQRMTRLVSEEILATARASTAMATSPSPTSFAQVQNTFMRLWFDRATTNCIQMGMLALSAQEAAMTPIRQTIAANTERLTHSRRSPVSMAS